ncbi:amidase [Amycolatopsis rubida]|uniref:Aspartyl-tRNA(Asn)/glutamyl-tRNA(Gln) amidotransferase subunit A n=1 Tax=Amycolatopsis rubida TaxID=112413 RepID=A0A1I6AQ79_9PSEU|nr:amidase [Amycolatopsis rubida]SFQ70747.1 aspartyl-tRNA(Asn)/glutamyl-tRNA(Gln) amidotransferase subunit A [Amycolatopsis rubida]
MVLSISEAAVALRTGRTTAVALAESAFAAADEHDAALGVYLSRFDGPALAAAERADAELAAGVDRGPLHGIPLAVKDLLATGEGETTAQSQVLDRAWGLRGDGPAVARLRAAGAVLTGKTTTMEFGIGAPDRTKPFPLPRNPWRPTHYAGGSSSGSASAVAAGLVLGSLGTDTAGSIRYPAALCGVSGLKPTYGRVPKNGCVPLAPGFDHIGPLARSAEDCALLLTVLAGPDPGDPSSAGHPVEDYRGGLTESLSGLRIGVVPHAEDRAFERAVAVLRDAGARTRPVELPYCQELKTVTKFGLAAEAFAWHRTNLQHRWSDYGASTRMALARGALVSAGDYVQMQRVRRAGQRKLAQLFAEVDLVVTPTATRGAPEIEGLSTSGMADTALTSYWNAAGNPALSVPMGFTGDGLPLGLQIAGRPFAEATVLAAGHAYQQRTSWHLQTPWEIVR